MKPAEISLLNAIQSGGSECEAALKRLYDIWRPGVISYVRANNGSRTDAIDLLQDIVIVFYSAVKRGSFNRESSIGTYQYSIMKNLWLKKLKRKKTRDKHRAELNLAEEYMNSSKFIDNEERYDQILSILSKLGSRCKAILIDVYYYSYSMKEISERMKYENEQVARNKKYKCLKSLKAMIKGKENSIRSILESTWR